MKASKRRATHSDWLGSNLPLLSRPASRPKCARIGHTFVRVGPGSLRESRMAAAFHFFVTFPSTAFSDSRDDQQCRPGYLPLYIHAFPETSQQLTAATRTGSGMYSACFVLTRVRGRAFRTPICLESGSPIATVMRLRRAEISSLAAAAAYKPRVPDFKYSELKVTLAARVHLGCTVLL